MTQVPNVEGTKNAFVATGGQMGTIVGNTTSETVGFYGNAGVAQSATIATIGNSATGTEIATAVNALIARLKATGEIAAS